MLLFSNKMYFHSNTFSLNCYNHMKEQFDTTYDLLKFNLFIYKCCNK